ncbi:MAG: hypothetical protein GX235_09070 [Clostridiales bacterium]|nr:hypothetical protein [Clostridiales bacterium]
MFDKSGRYIIENYGRKTVFSSFLPGISGKLGIPVWSFYVNRGQGISSFGSSDKDHSIMEFYPAHQAYQMTKRQGFRTFVKKDGKYLEPFADEKNKSAMYIGMNEFEIEEVNEEEGIRTNVLYYTLPGENIGGLVREVTFKNISGKKMHLEVLDGMPALIPYGVSLSEIKDIGQTVKAWMKVEDEQIRLPYFRVRTSITDSIAVQEIKEGNYSFAVTEDGDRLPVIVDPEVIFSYDTSLTKSVGLEEGKLTELLERRQITENNVPCSFFAIEKELGDEESFTIYEITGAVESKEILKEFSDKCVGRKYFEDKRAESIRLTEDLCEVIHTKTGNPVFDAYCKQTYLDNLLRGGYPVKIGKEKIFYLYSRKHGDIERDYNFFQMLPEFYSQGNANFRDVNQNRRCDVMFAPYVGDANIKTFYNLIQTDGYNPLQVQKAVYTIEAEKVKRLEHFVKDDFISQLKNVLSKPFTPGSLAGFAGNNKILKRVEGKDESCVLEEFVGAVMDEAQSIISASFGEGYWTDHWTYNLDLVETYLAIYPDKEEELLFDDASFTYYESQAAVNPRRLRYEETEKGIRQYHTLNYEIKKGISGQCVRAKYGKGDIYYTTLMEKLLLLCSVKFAALDPYGMGIEMEGGKPGWYDALNGLPGLLGSSMCETYELRRMLDFVIEELQNYGRTVVCAEEIADMMTRLSDALGAEAGNDRATYREVLSDKAVQEESLTWNMTTWNTINAIKEEYREKTLFGLSGKTVEVSAKEALHILHRFRTLVSAGIERALECGKGISPAYFTYEVTDYEKTEAGIIVKQVNLGLMPRFLEGPVRFMKLNIPKEEKEDMYRRVKESGMYDEKLRMYKVNESLRETGFEVGRTRAFTPGWLENESIWLHMEYKYLLELLKSGMYKEFIEDFKDAAVPFLDAGVYGRSPLENSSFIVSSANSNGKIHGKGFVARLSGSTAEFIHMWQIMMFGLQPFRMGKNGTELRIMPMFPRYLIGQDKKIEAVFLGKIPITFRLAEQKDYTPGSYEVRIKILHEDARTEEYEDGIVTSDTALLVRSGKVKRIEVFMS